MITTFSDATQLQSTALPFIREEKGIVYWLPPSHNNVDVHLIKITKWQLFLHILYPLCVTVMPSERKKCNHVKYTGVIIFVISGATAANGALAAHAVEPTGLYSPAIGT